MYSAMPMSSSVLFVAKPKEPQQKKRNDGKRKRWKLIRRLFSRRSNPAQICAVCVCNQETCVKKIHDNTTQPKTIALPSGYANVTFVLTSGKKVPFTREMHKKKRLKTINKMECITE